MSDTATFLALLFFLLCSAVSQEEINPPITFKLTNIFYPLNLQKIIRMYIFPQV